MTIQTETLMMAAYAYGITVLCVAAGLILMRSFFGADSISTWDSYTWLTFMFICFFPVLLLIPVISSIFEFLSKERSLKEDLKSFVKNIKTVCTEIAYNIDTYDFEQEKFLCFKILTDRHASVYDGFSKSDNNMFCLSVRAKDGQIFDQDGENQYNLVFIFHKNKIYIVEHFDLVVNKLQRDHKNIYYFSVGRLVGLLKDSNAICEEFEVSRYTLLGFINYRKMFLFYKKDTSI